MWVLDDAQTPIQIWSGVNATKQHSVSPNEQAVPSSVPLAELETQVLHCPRRLGHAVRTDTRPHCTLAL